MVARAKKKKLKPTPVTTRPASEVNAILEELKAGGHLLYVPPGCAHGYLTLVDDTEVFYQMSCAHEPAAFRGQFEIAQPAFKGWGELENKQGATTFLFPFLFVTIACGACSGFHGLVCSGTTSKQIEPVTHTRAVGYGAMLMEAFVALIAMSTILIVAQSDKMPGPGRIFGDGIGKSRLKLPVVKQGTARNMNSVAKIAELLAGME